MNDAFWLQQIDQTHDTPDAPPTVAAYADWLEEQGEQEAADCLHWCVMAEKWPEYCERTCSFDWWVEGDYLLFSSFFVLPELLFVCLQPGKHDLCGVGWNGYLTPSDAFLALADAWRSLSSADRDTLLRRTADAH